MTSAFDTAASLTLVVPAPFDTRTGGYEYDRRIVAALQDLGWHVDVVELPGQYPQPSPDDRRAAVAALRGVPDGRLVLADGLAFSALPDEVQVERARLRFVALVHHPLAAETGIDPEAARKLYDDERRALDCARQVVVTSPATADALAPFHVPSHRIAVIEPGTQPAPIAIGSKDAVPTLLAVGSIIPRKGYRVLVEAMAQLADRPWRLVCAGGDRDPVEALAVRSAVAAHDLASRVTFPGELGPDALARVYASADLFVLPTLYEGYGMVVAEALARGLPVVSTATGGIAGLVGAEAGMLVAAGDSRALAAAVGAWLDDVEIRKRWRAGAIAARASLATWSERGVQMATVLRSVA